MPTSLGSTCGWELGEGERERGRVWGRKGAREEWRRVRGRAREGRKTTGAVSYTHLRAHETEADL
eukprot:831554-Rhodomonas_salina.2